MLTSSSASKDIPTLHLSPLFNSCGYSRDHQLVAVNDFMYTYILGGQSLNGLFPSSLFHEAFSLRFMNTPVSARELSGQVPSLRVWDSEWVGDGGGGLSGEHSARRFPMRCGFSRCSDPKPPEISSHSFSFAHFHMLLLDSAACNASDYYLNRPVIGIFLTVIALRTCIPVLLMCPMACL